MQTQNTNRTIDGRLINEARNRRQGAFVRRHVAVLLGYPVDCCTTTGEMETELASGLSRGNPDGAQKLEAIRAEARNVL